MAVLLSGTMLRKRLSELARKSQRIDIAVAWATPSGALTELLSMSQRLNSDVLRIHVGVSGFVTHPEALRSIRSFASLRVHVQPGVLFHPKLYIFHLETTRICWVGSPNLTRRAFEENIELAAEVEDPDGQILSHFDELWNSPGSTSEFNVDSYEKAWFKAVKKLPPFLKREASPDSIFISKPEILISRWKDFAADLRRTGDLKAAVETISKGHEFVRSNNWTNDLTAEGKGIMFGLLGMPFSHFGFLDRVLRTQYEHFIGKEDPVIRNRLRIRDALRPVIDAKTFDQKMAEDAFNKLCAVKGCGPALATRLLLFARPDWFVVYNKKSRKWLGKFCDVSLPIKPNGSQYAALIESIRHKEWWQSPRPENPDEAQLWNYRAALTDRFAFEEYEAGREQVY